MVTIMKLGFMCCICSMNEDILNFASLFLCLCCVCLNKSFYGNSHKSRLYAVLCDKIGKFLNFALSQLYM